MAYILGYNLTPVATNIIEKLYYFRGMTAVQLATSLYSDSFSLSQEKNIYNYLGKLKKQKLITSLRLQGDYSKGSMYYLTRKGYDFAKLWLNIEENQRTEGWITKNEAHYGDIPYDILRPPLDQTTHHLMSIDLSNRLLNISSENLTDNHVSIISFRSNLYAAKTYQDNISKYRFRPDAEVKFEDGRLFTVEIDMGTESLEQLRSKFKVYKHYFDYLKSTDRITEIPSGILFVVETKRREHGIKRRWLTILSAFYGVIGAYHSNVNLILTPMDRVTQTLGFEAIKIMLEKETFKKYQPAFKKHSIEATKYIHADSKENAYILCKKENISRTYFLAFSQTYESKVYSRFHRYMSWLNNSAKKQNIDSKCGGIIISHVEMAPNLVNLSQVMISDEHFFRNMKEFELLKKEIVKLSP